MKLLLFLLLIVPMVLGDNRQCRNACKVQYGSYIGGRKATTDDKGPFGFNSEVDCTCVFPWFPSSNKRECYNYCDNLQQHNKYCLYTAKMCLPHVGLGL